MTATTLYGVDSAAELAVVGACRDDPAQAVRVLEIVAPHDFADARLGRVLLALDGLERVTLPELAEVLEREQPRQRWPELLAVLVDEGGVPADALRLAGVVRRQALARERAALLAHLAGGPDAAALARVGAIDAALESGALLDPARARPVLVSLADVTPERVAWLWEGRVPRGKLTILDGDPGLGKSSVTLDLVARVTTGRPMPDGTPGVTGGAVLLSAEDGLADTIRPRLDAAGADVSRVVALAGVRLGAGERLPELPLDLAAVETAVERASAVLVVVDPLMAYLGAETNSYRDQDVRRALAPLAALAERSGAAVVRHLRKTMGGPATHAGGGSIGIIGAARSGLLVARDPEDDARRVLAQSKSNLGPPAPSLGYRIVAAGDAAAVEWLGESGHSAGALLAASATDAEGRSALEEAREWLGGLVLEGAVPAADVQRRARADGIADATLRRAKSALGVRSRRQGFGPGSLVVWELPGGGPPTGGPIDAMGAHT